MATQKNEKDPKKSAEERLRSKAPEFSAGAGTPDQNKLDTSKKGYGAKDMKIESPAGEKWAKMKTPPKPKNGIIQKDDC